MGRASGRARELASRVVELGTAAGLTVGTAESCTAGLVAAALGGVSGASEVLRGGVVSYVPEVKHAVLGVGQATIDEPGLGVVSLSCAEQMAEGARRVLGADVAVSVTGIAGPTGTEAGKPVGTVWLGLATPHGSWAELRVFCGDRQEVRARACERALELLCVGLVSLSPRST